MSIQWTFLAGYLYFEIAVVIILISPIFSPRYWYNFFHSRLFTMFKKHAGVYFLSLLAILCLFLTDSIREVQKYSHSNDPGHTKLANELKANVKLFRGQRNFYITGFSIFLTFVIRRLITMIMIQYELQLKAEAIINKAEDAVKLAKTTVLTNSLENNAMNYEETKNKLSETEILLEEHTSRVKELEEEASKWRLKYEEIKSKVVGQGDI